MRPPATTHTNTARFTPQLAPRVAIRSAPLAPPEAPPRVAVALVARLVVEEREEVLLLDVMFAMPPIIIPSVPAGSLVLGPEIVTSVEAARRVAAGGVGNEKVAERAWKEDEASALAVA